MQRYISILAGYFAQYFKARIAHRGDFVISLISSLFATAASFGFLLVLFQRVPSLKGWSFYEVLFIYAFSLIPLGLFNIVSLNLYEFGESYVIEGKFDRVLLRPINSLFQVIFEAFRLESLQEILLGLGILAFASHKLGLSWSIGGLVLLLIMSLSGALIYVSIFLALTSVSFWMEDRIGISPPVFNMIAFGRYPMTIYNTAVQFFLSWIIPLAFASFYPTTVFLQRNDYKVYFYLVPVIAAISFSLSALIWSRGVRHYGSTGS